MKRPTDLLAYDPQSEPAEPHGAARESQFGKQQERAAEKSEPDACRAGDPFEYGKAMAGLASALKARNKSARQSGGVHIQKAKARSRQTLTRALSRIFDEQGGPGGDDVMVRRPLKKPEDV